MACDTPSYVCQLNAASFDFLNFFKEHTLSIEMPRQTTNSMAQTRFAFEGCLYEVTGQRYTMCSTQCTARCNASAAFSYSTRTIPRLEILTVPRAISNNVLILSNTCSIFWTMMLLGLRVMSFSLYRYNSRG